jgi:hypothetical protein
MCRLMTQVTMWRWFDSVGLSSLQSPVKLDDLGDVLTLLALLGGLALVIRVRRRRAAARQQQEAALAALLLRGQAAPQGAGHRVGGPAEPGPTGAAAAAEGTVGQGAGGEGGVRAANGGVGQGAAE